MLGSLLFAVCFAVCFAGCFAVCFAGCLVAWLLFDFQSAFYADCFAYYIIRLNINFYNYMGKKEQINPI